MGEYTYHEFLCISHVEADDPRYYLDQNEGYMSEFAQFGSGITNYFKVSGQ